MTTRETGSSPAALAQDHELAQARLAVATEAAQLGLWDWDITDGALVWDARSIAMYGQGGMPLTGDVSDINRTIHVDDQARVGAELERAIAARGSIDVEFRVVHPDGGERTIYARGQVLLDAAGDAVRMIGTNADVTEARAVERRAVQDAERRGALVDVARALGDARSEAAVLDVVDAAARELMGASGAAVLLLTAAGTVGVSMTLPVGEELAASTAELPLDTPLPPVDAVATGRSHFHADRAAGAVDFPGGEQLWEAVGVEAAASVPLVAEEGVFGSLAVGLPHRAQWRPADRQLVEAFASLVGQALRRIWAGRAEAAATREAQRTAAQQAALVALASSLELATSEEEVLAVVTGGGVGLLGARGTVLCLREDDAADGSADRAAEGAAEGAAGGVRTLTTRFFDDRVRSEVASLPLAFPLPMVDAVSAGRAHFLADRDEAVALFADGEAVTRPLYAQAGTEASAALPLRVGGTAIGSLSLAFDAPRSWTGPERRLLEAFAALTAQTLSRLRARAAEEAAHAAARRFSETLQRSLLTSPPEPDHLHIVVRYVPAATEAQVGGDWYDAFLSRDGDTCLVVGDVTGHDREAAAAMGQVRNLLRGIAHVTGGSPAEVLSSLDAAVQDLDVGSMATVVLAKVVQTPDMRTRGERLLRWSNAGHPPPLLLQPDGTARFLETDPDLLIGLAPHLPRHDHEVVLEPGATLLVYTDGLVERRGAPLSDGLAWLADCLEELHALTPDALCDELLRRIGSGAEDDVALVAVRAHPQDAPRPGSAGPTVVPDSVLEATSG